MDKVISGGSFTHKISMTLFGFDRKAIRNEKYHVMREREREREMMSERIEKRMVRAAAE